MPGPSQEQWRQTNALLYGAATGLALNLVAGFIPQTSLYASRIAVASVPLAALVAHLMHDDKVPHAAIFVKGALFGMPVAFLIRLLLVGVGYVGYWLYAGLHLTNYSIRLW